VDAAAELETVRNAVWDRLHGFTEPPPPGDVDCGLWSYGNCSQ